MNKNQFLSMLSTYCWPITRQFVKKPKRCKQCILSEKHSKLTNGICAECVQFEKKSIQSNKNDSATSELVNNFYQFLNSIKSDAKYHALLLLSGGKDSAYILEKLRTEFPFLKILCLFVENGFSSTFAVQNAVYLTQKLNVDLMIANEAINDFSKSFRSAFLSLNGAGSSGVVDKADGTKIFQIGNHTAKQMNIPYVIGGLSWTQVKMILNNDSFIFKEENQPSLISPLAVWRPKEEDIRAYVREKNLVLKGSDNPIVSNNDLIIAMCAIDVLNNGYCSFEPEFAQMIREGKAKRNVWLYNFELLEFATSRGLLKKDISNTLAKLNLRLDDVLQPSKLDYKGY